MIPNSEVNVTIGNSSLFFISAQNKRGIIQQCKVSVKFRNLSQSIPNTAHLMPSSLSSIVDFSFSLMDNETWEHAFEFRIIEIESVTMNQSSYVLEVNGQQYDAVLDAFAEIPSTDYIYQFIYELWLFDEARHDFVFSGVWVSSPFLKIT